MINDTRLWLHNDRDEKLYTWYKHEGRGKIRR